MPMAEWAALLAAVALALATPVARAGARDFTLTDHLRRDWRDEPVHFPIEFAPAECDGKRVRLTQLWDGVPAPVQLTGIERHGDGSMRKGRVTFLADLPARQARTWRFEWGKGLPAAQPPTPFSATREGEDLVISTGAIAVRVPAGEGRFRQPVPAAQVPAPLLGVRGPDGHWRGKAWLDSPLLVESWEAGFSEDGAVVKEYRVLYRFVGGKSYQATLRLHAGLNHAHIIEEANVDKASRFVFSAHTGFAPTHRVRQTLPPEPLGYKENRRLIRLVFNTYYHQIFDFNQWLGLYRDGAGSRDYLGFIAVNGGDWTSPLHNTLHVVERTDPDLRLEGTLRPCRREWLVAMFDRTRDQPPKGEYPYGRALMHLCARVGFAPLDEIKDMTLDWPLKRQPRPLTDNDKETAQYLIERLSDLARSWPSEGPYGSNFALGYGQRKRAWRAYPKIAGCGALSEEDERFARAALAMIAYVGMQRDFFAWYFPLLPWEDTSDAEEPLENWRPNFYMMNTNFDSSRFTGIAEIALSIRDHPDFEKFIAHYKQCLRLHLDNVFSEDGYYHEGPSYFCWNLFVLTTTMERMKRELGLDSFDEPRYRKALATLVNLATPPDPRYGGARSIPPFGDHDPRLGAFERFQAEGKGLLTVASEAYAARDPALAGALAWLWHEVKAQGAPPQPAPKAPALGHERIRGWGAVLRWNSATPRESYLAYRCDPFVGRYLNIENCFHLHALGRPLVVTPSSVGFVGGEPWGSRAFNKVSFNGLSTYEHFWGQLGVLEDYQALGDTAYLRGFVASDAYQRKGMNWDQFFRDKPHAHRRHLLGVRGDYYVLTDEVQCQYPSDFFLHVLASRAERSGRRFRFTGHYDVDLDIHLFAPTKAQVRTVPRRMANQGDPKNPWDILSLEATAPPNELYFTVLVPFPRGAEPLRVERLGQALALRVTGPTSAECVFLSPAKTQWQDGGLRFEGTRGLLRTKPRTELTLLDAGIVSDGKVTLRSDAGGVTLAAQTDGAWEALADGAAKTLSLDGLVIRELHLDGQPHPWKPDPAGAVISLPPGSHRFRVR